MTQASSSEEKSHSSPNTQTLRAPYRTTWIGLGSLLSVTSLLAIFLTLLGYGVAFSIETELGLPHATLFTSAFELIDLSSVAITTLVTIGSPHAWSVEGFLKLASNLWPVAVFFFSTWTVLLLWIRNSQWFKKNVSLPSRVKTWFRKPTEKDSSRQFLRSFIWPMTATLLGYVLAYLMGIAIVLAPTLLALVPVLGYELGKAHIKEWVVGAEICTPLATREARKEPRPKSQKVMRSNNCVALTKDGKTVAEGLVVLTTSSSIVLYSPMTGAARRERTDGVAIEAIEDSSWFASPARP